MPILFLVALQVKAMSQVSAFVDRQKLPLNESLTFTIQIEFQNKEPENLILPDLSELRDFNVLGRSSGTQQSISIVNGKMNRKQTLMKNYQLQPKTQGRLRLDSFDVKVDGKLFRTKELFIEVTAASAGPPISQPFFSSPFVPGFKNLFPDRFQKNKALVKFKLDLDKTDAYVGEMVLADWVIFTSVKSLQYQVEKVPMLKGFWKEELMTPSANTVFLGTEVIDNVLYRKERLHYVALFPVETGELEIDPYTIRIADLFSFSGQRRSIRSTKPRRLPVKPLPAVGQGNFSGAVGDFRVQTSLSEQETQTGKPISYKLRFEGQGGVRDIQPPKIPFPASVKVYPPAEKSEFTSTKSWKEFEFLIIPQETGLVTIPAFSFTTFYPKLDKYRVHSMPTLSFNVTKGDTKELTENLSFFDKKEKKPKTPQWNFLNKETFFIFNQTFLLKFWGVFYTILILAFVSLYSIRRKNRTKISLKEDLEIQLKKIQQLADKKHEEHEEKAAVALINLIYQTVSRITQDRKPSQEWRKMLQALPPSLHRKFAEPLTRLIQDLEAFSFAPKGNFDSRKSQTKGMALSAAPAIHPLLKRTQNLLRKMAASMSHTSEDHSE